MILPSIHEYPWETVVARDLLAEVERERNSADTVRLSNREMLHVIDVKDATIATLRGAVDKYIRESKAEGLRHLDLPSGASCQCDLCQALATAQEE